MPQQESSKPVGQVTRGKTTAHRLRQTDAFLALAYRGHLLRKNCLYVDLGYGHSPITTVETFQRFRRVNASFQMLGVEIDPERVRDAGRFSQTGLGFKLGGFNLPLEPERTATIVRAFNVLRQYDESQVTTALATLQARMAKDALLIEGTCDPTGRLLTFNLFIRRANGLEMAAFVFAPRLSALTSGFQPAELRAVLTKNHIHHATPGGAIDKFFLAWHKSWQHARSSSDDVRQIFAQSATRLAEVYGYPVDLRRSFLRRAFLVLAPSWASPD